MQFDEHRGVDGSVVRSKRGRSQPECAIAPVRPEDFVVRCACGRTWRLDSNTDVNAEVKAHIAAL